MKTEEVVVEIYPDRTETEIIGKTESVPLQSSNSLNPVILSGSGKTKRKIYPKIEFQYGVEFASFDKDGIDDKYEIRNIINNSEDLPEKDTLCVPREIYSLETTDITTKTDDLWCGNSTEDCVTTCATVDFFLASLKSAWIAIVLILLYKSSLMSPTNNSLMDFIMNEERRPNTNSSLGVCLITQDMSGGQRKGLLLLINDALYFTVVLVVILIMGFPILPLEFLLTKSIFFAAEQKNRVKITMWLVIRGVLLVIFATQALYKYTCFAFENFDLITIPEIVYRIFELHVVARFLSEITENKES